jgi:hypothetical protein
MADGEEQGNIHARDMYGVNYGPDGQIIQNFYGTPRSANLYQLPIDPPNFTGRDREIAQITDRLRQPGQVVGIFAMSGIRRWRSMWRTS